MEKREVRLRIDSIVTSPQGVCDMSGAHTHTFLKMEVQAMSLFVMSISNVTLKLPNSRVKKRCHEELTPWMPNRDYIKRFLVFWQLQKPLNLIIMKCSDNHHT